MQLWCYILLLSFDVCAVCRAGGDQSILIRILLHILNAVIEGKYILLCLTFLPEPNSIVHMLHDSNVDVETHTESILSICTQSSVIA